MRWHELDQQACSMARTVAVIGDRWTLMILRDCFLRVRRFEDFQRRLGITRPLLASRLAMLVDESVLVRTPYQERPLRHEYRLTAKGLDLYPVVMAIVHWGDVHMAGPEGRPLLHTHRHCGHDTDPRMVCSVCGEPLRAQDVSVRPGPGAAPTPIHTHEPAGIPLKQSQPARNPDKSGKSARNQTGRRAKQS